MIDIEKYIAVFQQKLLQTFGKELFFFGIQGSYARGEATENSDIDVVVILNELTSERLLQYNNMVDTLPFREKLCGFVSGKQELLHWIPFELFQFYYDTKAIFGTLDCLFPLLKEQDIKMAVKSGACTIYHSCCHNMIHEKSIEIVKALYKSAVFVMQAKYFLKTAQYSSTKKELLEKVNNEDKKILAQNLQYITEQTFQSVSEILLNWASHMIIEY